VAFLASNEFPVQPFSIVRLLAARMEVLARKVMPAKLV
jgi:hypothetical protein